MANPSWYSAIPQAYILGKHEKSYIIGQAIMKINPTPSISIGNPDDLNTITFHEGTDPIPVADIEAQIAVVEAELQAEAAAGTQREK